MNIRSVIYEFYRKNPKIKARELYEVLKNNGVEVKINTVNTYISQFRAENGTEEENFVPQFDTLDLAQKLNDLSRDIPLDRILEIVSVLEVHTPDTIRRVIAFLATMNREK